MKEIKLCLIGFGNAAKAFCNLLLLKQKEIESAFDCSITISAIAGRSKGSALNTNGIVLKDLLANVKEFGDFKRLKDYCDDGNVYTLIEQSEADVLIELSSLSINDGQPAISYIEKAFEMGMSVITANKGPVAWDYTRLNSIASRNKLAFLCETTVMDGTPVFNLYKETLPLCRVESIKGILNSTSNFIIEEMEKNITVHDAIKKAQERGFAEADPSLDIEGWDAAAKTAVLANVLMGASITPFDIDREGVTELTLEEVQDAVKTGKKVKLICEAWRSGESVSGSVKLKTVERDEIYANIDSTSSVLSLNTDLMGEVVIIEKNPEIEQTGYGVFSDLMTYLKERSKEKW